MTFDFAFPKLVEHMKWRLRKNLRNSMHAGEGGGGAQWHVMSDTGTLLFLEAGLARQGEYGL